MYNLCREKQNSPALQTICNYVSIIVYYYYFFLSFLDCSIVLDGYVALRLDWFLPTNKVFFSPASNTTTGGYRILSDSVLLRFLFWA